MIRKGFVMSVNPDKHAQYRARHATVWPEMLRILKEHGVSNYSIFLHSATSQLFGYVEIESEERWRAISQTEICRNWWKYMKDSMLTNPDDSPRTIEIDEVFHLD